MGIAIRLVMFSFAGILTACAGFQVAGQFQAGRQALLINQPENALPYFLAAADRDPDSVYNMARLYLGLTLALSGDAARGVKEIESGMNGLHDWLEYIERTRPFEAYWDPTREIRGAIEKDLDKISSKDIDPQQLIADAEWVGQRMESEIDRARRDERRRYENEFDRRRGPSVGVGVGF